VDRSGDRSRQDLTPQLSIVIPVYNEGEAIRGTIEGLLGAVRARPLEILVVYDFDEDTTLPVLRSLHRRHPEIVPHRNTLGPGVLNALRSGFAAANAPFVVVTMGDASDDPADIDRMLAVARSGADVVAASRYMPGGRQVGGPLPKRTLSRLAGLSLYALGRIGTHDATNNFKLYSRRLLDRIEIESRGGFELAIELTVKAHKLGLPIREVPTTWRDRTAGESRFMLRKWLPHYLRWFVKGLRPVRSKRNS
jgi:dolichol-phosphate mannosyltransferase